jgi:hypothetical protein
MIECASGWKTGLKLGGQRVAELDHRRLAPATRRSFSRPDHEDPQAGEPSHQTDRGKGRCKACPPADDCAGKQSSNHQVPTWTLRNLSASRS